MNPFNLNKKYDDSLSEILSKINRSSSATAGEGLRELVEYLPRADVSSDLQAILKAIKPLLGTPSKLLVNKVLYFLLKRSKGLQSIQVPWIYHNVDSQDPYAKKIFENYFDVRSVSSEFESFLTWDDFLKDLSCFLYLVQRSDAEHYFDMEKLQLQTYFEFDTLFEILRIIRGKQPIEFLKVTHQGDFQFEAGGYSRIAREAFLRIKAVRSSLFLNKKYRILLEIYDFIDDSVYEESKHLDCSVLRRIVERGTDCNRLRVSTVDQIAVVLPKVRNPTEFILGNMHSSICIFDLIQRTGVKNSTLLENKEIFTPIANESLRKHYVAKTCAISKGSSNTRACEVDLQTLQDIFALFTGRYKIISSSLLGLKLDPSDFEFGDIEETMEFAVGVFPKPFFLNREFNASAIPLLKAYPGELERPVESLEGLVSNFSKTKRTDVARLIDNVPALKRFLDVFPLDEIKRLYQTSSINRTLRIVYLYYLRSDIEPFEVEYAQVFDHFFSKGFLKFLLGSKYSISNFVETTVNYIRNLDLPNSVLCTGFNFDEDPQFYYNLKQPTCDAALKVLLSVLESLKLDSNLEILLNLIRIILYKPVHISAATEYRDGIRDMFDFGKNNFIVERYIREFLGQRCTRLNASTLSINRNKARDVILRYFKLSDKFAHNLNPSFLSNPSLSSVVDSIAVRFSGPEACVSDFSAISSVRIFPESDSLADAIPSLSLSSDHIEATSIKSSTSRSLDDDEVGDLIESLFVKRESASPLDFIYLIESDSILQDKDFRSERIEIYAPLIRLLSGELSKMFINLYSFSKLEGNSTDEAVLDFILEPVKDYRCSFWILLASTLHKINNIYISMFIEKMVLRNLEGGGTSYFSRNQIVDLKSYAELCSGPELNIFACAFPLVYPKLRSGRAVGLEKLIMEIADIKIDNGKLSFSKTNEFHRLRLVYRADSINHEASIYVPLGFPEKKARIEFDHGASKNTKFYHKLNELLSKTSKFVEILLLWKVDIDNHLAGYTECLICYFIMEPKHRTLPSFKCPNCANCYHEKCIYKWVAESRNKQCPLCRIELPLWQKN